MDQKRNMPPGAPDRSYFYTWLIHWDADMALRELRTSASSGPRTVLCGLLWLFSSHLSQPWWYFTWDHVWGLTRVWHLSGSTRMGLVSVTFGLAESSGWVRFSIWFISEARCMSSGTSSEIVGNRLKSHPLGMLSAWLESANQVFRNPHTGFLKLGDVSFHVNRSDFSHDVCARHGSGQVKYPQKHWIIP